ncbi:MAG: hypothetical protein ABIQ52_10015 [Vicinamibacterales bacterium]
MIFINCERTSTVLTFVQVGANRIRRVNTSSGLQWYAGGLWRYVPIVPASDYNTYFHTDADTAETVPWRGLESVTRRSSMA